MVYAALEGPRLFTNFGSFSRSQWHTQYPVTVTVSDRVTLIQSLRHY